MNQTQIRYLDRRMQEQRNLLANEIEKKATAKKRRVTEQFRGEFEKSYVRALSNLPKEELLERLAWVFRQGISDINGYNGWNKGIFDVNPSGNGYYNRPDLVIEIDGLVEEWNSKATALIDSLQDEKNRLVSKLNADMDALRDKLNLEGCDMAVKLLGDLVVKWTAAIDSMDQPDGPKTRRRK